MKWFSTHDLPFKISSCPQMDNIHLMHLISIMSTSFWLYYLVISFQVILYILQKWLMSSGTTIPFYILLPGPVKTLLQWRGLLSSQPTPHSFSVLTASTQTNILTLISCALSSLLWLVPHLSPNFSELNDTPTISQFKQMSVGANANVTTQTSW